MGFLSPYQMLQHFPLGGGARVADFGVGSGTYTNALLERNSNYTVYAIDCVQEHTDVLHRAHVHESRDNIFPLTADICVHIPLNNELLNGALLVNTLHALNDHAQFLKELHRVMCKKGSVLVVDWIGSFNNMGPTDEQVLTPGEAVRRFKGNGFTVGEMLPAGTHHYAFIATKT